MAEARVGTTIKGKWHLDRLIGVGGMAAVYSATHRNRKRAALKILHPEYSREDSIRERFLREGYVANTVGHPGVIRVDDDDITDDGAVFLVMELVEGETLDERLAREGPLPADEVLGYFVQVLDTVAMAHARGIIHRDLKPENMLLSIEGKVRLLDFGIARVRELTTDPRRTLTEGLMGTPAFMPPEQARGNWNEVDIRSDLWALGASMFTLLTGCYVHDAETSNEALAVAISERARPLRELRPDLPEALCKIVDRALEYEKEARWPNATVMLLAVEQARTQLETAASEAKRAEAVLLSARASDPEIEVRDGLEAISPKPSLAQSSSALTSKPSSLVEVDDDDWPDPEPLADASSASDLTAVLEAPRPPAAFEAAALLDATSAPDVTALLEAPPALEALPPLDVTSAPDVTALLEAPPAFDELPPPLEAQLEPPALEAPPALDSLGLAESEPDVALGDAPPPPASGRHEAARRHSSADYTSEAPRSLGANLLADVPFGAITFEPSTPPPSLSATATPEPELGASAAEKLRRAVAALEAFESQRKADERLSAEEGDTDVAAPRLELMAASRTDTPLEAADGESEYRTQESSDEELTVVRPNPLVAQERAAYRDSQVDLAAPQAEPVAKAEDQASAESEAASAESEAASAESEAASAAPAETTSDPPAAVSSAQAARPARAAPAAPSPARAAPTPPRPAVAVPRATYLEPTAPPRADRRGTVDGSVGPTVAVVDPSQVADTESADLPRRRVSTVASGAPTIITRRAPAPPPSPTMSTLWSLAATLVAVAGVVTGVVWFVQKNQGAVSAVDAPAPAKLQAARTAPLDAPLPSAVPAPVDAPKSAAPEPNSKAESVELEALPVLPSLQVDPARVRLEQAREATKREFAAQEAPTTQPPKAAPAAKP